MRKIWSAWLSGLVMILLVGFALAATQPVLAEESTSASTEKQSAIDRLNQEIQDLQNKIKDAQNEQNTLASTIKFLDSKILLTGKEIEKSEREIELLEAAIDDLGQRIQGLEVNLHDLSAELIERVQEQYKRSSTDAVSVIFATTGFTDLFKEHKYLVQLRAHTQRLLLDTETKRQQYDAEKGNKEAKQKEVEALRRKLEANRRDLLSQQAAKKQLLVETQNSEAKYQSLLAQAKSQLAALHRFVVGQGGASILQNQTKCDDWGCYYNQRDSQWGNISLGGSSYSVAEYGCLVSSVAMVATHYGKNIKPADIAVISAAFVPGYGWLYHSFAVNGTQVNLTSASRSLLDNELAAGRPVIAGLYSGPDHFIVIVRKEGDNYIMHDPFLENGSYRSLTDKYNVADIRSLRLVRFN